MKPIATALTLLLTLATSALAFEGSVTYQLTDANGKTSTLACQVKGDRVLATSDRLRVEGTLLIIPTEKTFYTLVPMLRVAMKQALPDVAASARSLGAVEVQATTRKETVAGLPCTVYTFRSAGAEGETCAATGLDTLYKAVAAGGAWPAWAQDVMKKGLFPLRVVSKDKSGRTFRAVATEIHKKQISPAAMTVPADFHVVDGAALGGLLGGSAQP